MNALIFILVFRRNLGINLTTRQFSALHNLSISIIKIESVGFFRDFNNLVRCFTLNLVPTGTKLVRTFSKFLKTTLKKYLIAVTAALEVLSNRDLTDPRIANLLTFLIAQGTVGEDAGNVGEVPELPEIENNSK